MRSQFETTLSSHLPAVPVAEPPPATTLDSNRQVLELPGLSHWMKLGLMLARRAERGSLTVVLDDGRRLRLNGSQPGPAAMLQIHRQRLARRLLSGGNLSFGEAYLDGDFDSPDLVALVEWAAQNEGLDDALMGKPWYRWLRRTLHRSRANSRPGSSRNIAHHYDLGNDFYRLWLDPSMTYSAAIFEGDGQELEAAQHSKYRRLARLMQVRPGDEVLEIGVGWGGFACLLAEEFGCRVTGITISRAQFEYAARQVQQRGLGERVRIEFRDYRDVQGRFDRLASIEMLEAVGEQYWPVYFGKIHEVLRPGGIAGLQVITIADRYFAAYRGTMDYIQRYIFPGGMLPPPSLLRQHAAAAALRWQEDAGFGAHYGRTLRLWRDRFRTAWPDIQRLGFDERFRRMWEYYLAYCEGGFRAGTIDVRQIALVRP